MIRIATTVSISASALLLSLSAFAFTPDLSMLAQEELHGGGMHHIHHCMMVGWKAAEPTADQTKQAHVFIDETKAVYGQHKDAIKANKKNIFAAWSKHPIIKDDLVSAETAFHSELKPVLDSVQDTVLNTLNLLSDSQRKTFDQKFMACVHQ